MASPRVRRRPDEARRSILNAAASLLSEGGLAAVQVRAVAARVGMTDAGVTHHFGTRDTLLAELLRHSGRRLRTELQAVIDDWRHRGTDLGALVEVLADFYGDHRGELALALHHAGWRDPGAGMLDPVVIALHQRRPPASAIDDTRLAVAALHQAMATEAVYGEVFRRSAGLVAIASGRDAQIRWWTRQLGLGLTLDTR